MNKTYSYMRYIIVGLFALTTYAFSADVSSLNENEDQGTHRISLELYNLDGTGEPITFYMQGSKVSCLFWGPYFHVDKMAMVPETGASLPPLLSNWAEQLKSWCANKCSAEKYTKISIDIPDASSCAEMAKLFLSQAGFESKAYIYKMNLEDAVQLWPSNLGTLEDVDPTIQILTLESPFFSSAQDLFKDFNGTMKIPGLFGVVFKEMLSRDGKVYVHQSAENTIDGIMAFAPFLDKDGQKSLLVDSLFVAESSRHQNIGSKLIRTLLQEARRDEFKTLYWETGIGRQDAQEFYKKLNVQPYGTAFRYTPTTATQLVTFLPNLIENFMSGLLNKK